MAVDLQQVQEQLKHQRSRQIAEAAPVRLEMEMCGQRYMVLQRDRSDYESLGFRYVGPYVDGKVAVAPKGAKAKTEPEPEPEPAQGTEATPRAGRGG